ncbi:aminotransferase class V-fold PLP-dependent enzyme [Nocardioides caeni]|uniref:Aminotransferase class V-fold PLP-dependent enzyme n=1 Tax=Nocardioides caeni TaxID=574700 RepID=A0A4S8NN35_9ACTN|nr:aminotransferase class V-fold PLP-dependent enzyme [Nocardioides caeni]THV17692.1 aminotransferase class V-fold PLP-dependent enzyme [Nocardioides caeni]
MIPDPRDLARHYSRFAVDDRLLLTGHSHQAWPDVAREGVLDAFDDAAEVVDLKWARAEERAERLRAAVRELLDDPAGEVALGASTHDLLVRLLSSLDLTARPRLVTTDGEFHSARRQLARLSEAGLEVVRVPAQPAATLAARMADTIDARTAAVIVSSVLFETAQVVPELDALAVACARRGAELVVDAYHQLGVVPLSLEAAGLRDAWVLGGGYKYLQLGEGNCFLRLPSHAAGLRPLVTGWYAEFGDLADAPGGAVAYAVGAAGWAGSTYDPTSHYRAARVLDFFADQGLTPPVLREVSLHQRALLVQAFDQLDLPDTLVTRDRDTDPSGFAGFLTLFSDRAAELQTALAARGVHTDSRGPHLRFGPAPYLRDDQLLDAMAALGEVAQKTA